jgi:hypothetical protein
MYITRFQYLYIWESNLFITSYTVYICSNIYHTTKIYFDILSYLAPHNWPSDPLSSYSNVKFNLWSIIKLIVE